MITIPKKTILLLLLAMSYVSPSNAVSLIYPSQGQNQEQQDRDIHECNAQARQQSGLDPRRPLSRDEANASQATRQKRQKDIQTYNQVLATCLKERGYTVE